MSDSVSFQNNYQLRKITKTRGQFPNDTAAIKLLWLAICNLEDKRASERRKSRKTNKETLGNHLVEGAQPAAGTKHSSTWPSPTPNASTHT